MTKSEQHAANLAKAAAERQMKISTVIALWNGLTGALKDATPEQLCAQRLAWEYESQKDTIDSWKQDFAMNPAHAFEWAREAQIAAAKLEMIVHVALEVADGANEGVNIFGDVFCSTVNNMRSKMLRNDWAGTSTSASSNAMDSARREAVSQVLEDWQRMAAKFEASKE